MPMLDGATTGSDWLSLRILKQASVSMCERIIFAMETRARVAG